MTGGAADVGAANGKIFAAVPAIKIEVLAVHVAGQVATAEILVVVDATTTLKVADVITFDDALAIKSVRAYKG